MLFAIHVSVMNGTETTLDALDLIAARVDDDVHEVDVIDADQIEQTTWYRSSRPDKQKALEEAAAASLHRTPRTRGPHLRRVHVSDAASAAQARGLAYAPLLVLVENANSDGTLIRAALEMLASASTLELCLGAPSRLDPPAFQIESRGGHGELKKLVVTRLQEALDRGRPPRLVVVTDSDGEWQGDVKEHAQAIATTCAQAAVAFTLLRKRTVENYIPDGVWRAWMAELDHKAARPMVEALLRLSRDQRDHVNMANTGIAPWDQAKSAAEQLFQNPIVPAPDRALLQQGMLKGRKDAMMIHALRDHANALTPTDLMARDHHGDLAALVLHIENEL